MPKSPFLFLSSVRRAWIRLLGTHFPEQLLSFGKILFQPRQRQQLKHGPLSARTSSLHPVSSVPDNSRCSNYFPFWRSAGLRGDRLYRSQNLEHKMTFVQVSLRHRFFEGPYSLDTAYHYRRQPGASRLDVASLHGIAFACMKCRCASVRRRAPAGHQLPCNSRTSLGYLAMNFASNNSSAKSSESLPQN